MEQFKQKFIDEAVSLLINLETVVLDLENDASNIDHIQQVFRVMHTLKGVSGMYGFDSISEYTHHLENIYDFIRAEKVSLNQEILNLTFESIDHIKSLLQDEKLATESVSKKHFELMYRVSSLALKIEKEAKPEPVEPYGFFEDLENFKTYYIVFLAHEDFIEKGINLLEIFKDLSNIGEYRVKQHNFEENKRKAKINTLVWGIYLVTNRGTKTIEDILLFISEYCRILKIADCNMFSNEDFNEKFKELSTENQLDKQKKSRQSILQITENYNNSLLETSNNEVSDWMDAAMKPSEEIDLYDKATLIEQNENEPQRDLAKRNDNGVIHSKSRVFANNQDKTEPTKTKVMPEPKMEIDANESLSKQITSRISVDATKLDTLMYLVSELVTTRAQLDIINERKDWNKIDLVVEKIDKLTKGFRDNVLSIRLIPINDVAFRFKRLIRDLSQKLGKDIKFVTNGTETELDKSIIDALADPIMHIIRNAVDHGIELPEVRIKNGKSPQGVITFNAFHSGTNVFIHIQDDGKGIDPEKLLNCAVDNGFVSPDAKLSRSEILNLMFIPGLTTAENLTNISGRGVGMDVVKRKINEIRGEVEVESALGIGTSIVIKLQQTVSIMDTLLIQAGDTFFMIPVAEIEICEERKHSELFQNNNRQVSFDKNLVPFIHLRSEFNLGENFPKNEKVIFVVKNEIRFALVADRIIGEHQAVLKPLGRMLRHQEFLSGVSILGDGNLALMLDTNKLMQLVFKV